MIEENRTTGHQHYVGLATPSKTIKRLFREGLHREMSLKDLAVDLITNGTHEAKTVASAWFKNKERPKKVKKMRALKEPKIVRCGEKR